MNSNNLKVKYLNKQLSEDDTLKYLNISTTFILKFWSSKPFYYFFVFDLKLLITNNTNNNEYFALQKIPRFFFVYHVY